MSKTEEQWQALQELANIRRQLIDVLEEQAKDLKNENNGLRSSVKYWRAAAQDADTLLREAAGWFGWLLNATSTAPPDSVRLFQRIRAHLGETGDGQDEGTPRA